MSDKQKKKEDGEVSGDDDDDYNTSKNKKYDNSSKNDRKKSKRSSRSTSSRRISDKTSESKKSLKNQKDHKESSHRRSKSRSKDRKDQLKRKHSRSRSRSNQNDLNSTNKKTSLKDNNKESRRRSKSPTDKKTIKDKDRKKEEKRRSKSPKSNNNGKRKSSRSKSNKRDDTRKDNRDKDTRSSYKESDKNSYQTSSKDAKRLEEKENRQLTLEEQEERNERFKYQFDDSDSDYYQRVNDRKHKTSKRSRSKSKKRDRKRSTSKKRDDKKSKTAAESKSSKTEKENKNSSSKKEEGLKKKISQPEEELFEDNAFDIQLEDNSDDERERKKQDFLNMIKGIQNPNDNQILNQNSKEQNTESQNNKEKQQPEENNNQIVEEETHKSQIDDLQNENSEDQIYDNNLFNPNDAIDDDDNNMELQIDDDYKEGINESHLLTHRPSFEKAQFQHLKELEEMRNKETKEGLLDEPEQIPIQKRRSSKGQQKQEQPKKNDFFFDDIDVEQNNIHKLDEENQSDEEGDMFGDDIDKIIGKGAEGNMQIVKGVNAECDDEQNYYKILIGEVLGGKYRVVQKCGRGVYANVCKAEQLDNGKLVAIKMLRSNEIMHESGEREKEIVQKLNQSDKNDKKHIVRLKNVFDHQKHLCLVFECFAMNLRDALKEYGKGKGFSLDVVRSYAFQIFVAMTHLKKNRFIHADLKPDNLLISEDTKTLKMCDFGNVMQYEESRYYRAPEVLIGCPPFTAIDVWSIGVTLYEIYTQKILFDGTTNNEMLKLIMDARGKFNKKMLQSGQYVGEYFDQNFIFKYIQVDPNTKQKYITPITYGDIPKNDISKLLQANKENISFENQKKLSQFKDFLDKCLQLDPKNRITPEDALRHPFLDTTVKSK